eukprot:2806475-Prymnesium_polylepis.1
MSPAASLLASFLPRPSGRLVLVVVLASYPNAPVAPAFPRPPPHRPHGRPSPRARLEDHPRRHPVVPACRLPRLVVIAVRLWLLAVVRCTLGTRLRAACAQPR